MSDQVFKNVQVMKGIPVDQFMATMGFFSASLGMSCEDCHMADDRNWDGFAADNTRKRMARRMIQMMQKINADNFGGRQMVTCYSCHRGADSPRVVPDFGDPARAAAARRSQRRSSRRRRSRRWPDDVFNKLHPGGRRRAARRRADELRGHGHQRRIRTRVRRQARDRDLREGARRSAPSSSTRATATTRRRTTARSALACGAAASGRGARARGPGTRRARRSTRCSQFPAQVKQIAPRWRVGVATTIDDQDVDVVQGNSADGIDRHALLRSEDGPADALDSLHRFAGRQDSGAGRLRRTIAT